MNHYLYKPHRDSVAIQIQEQYKDVLTHCKSATTQILEDLNVVTSQTEIPTEIRQRNFPISLILRFCW
jgi:hypothetical protein